MEYYKWVFYIKCSLKRICASNATIDHFLQRKQPYTPQEATNLTESLQTMLVKDERHMSMADGEGFQ